jgi:2-amino-4-hydroxy-6-hydroxymethyldihydropteridine diphosphokinase
MDFMGNLPSHYCRKVLYLKESTCQFRRTVKETTAYISLGANLGEPEAAIREALSRLDGAGGVRVERASSFYAASPVGPRDQPDFVNAAARLRTTLNAASLLDVCQSFERAAGRTAGARWGPRILDVDIVFFGSHTIDTARLVIPHPRWRERLFVLLPLLELDPMVSDPSGRRVADIIEEGREAGIFTGQRVEKLSTRR